MSDIDVNEPTNAFLLDGDEPRLGSGSTPMLPNVAPPTVFSNVDSGPTLPLVSQVLTDGSTPVLPTLPTLPIAAPIAPASTNVVEADNGGEPRHPMAHLMPEKSRPSEASMRAAELRAAKKKKAKKVKIIVGVCAVAVTAIVGPPLAKWTMNAINEAGTVQDKPAEKPAANTGGDPQATPAAGQQAIDEAKKLAANTTPPIAP